MYSDSCPHSVDLVKLKLCWTSFACHECHSVTRSVVVGWDWQALAMMAAARLWSQTKVVISTTMQLSGYGTTLSQLSACSMSPEIYHIDSGWVWTRYYRLIILYTPASMISTGSWNWLEQMLMWIGKEACLLLRIRFAVWWFDSRLAKKVKRHPSATAQGCDSWIARSIRMVSCHARRLKIITDPQSRST